MQELLNQYTNLCARIGQLKHQESVLLRQLDLVSAQIAQVEAAKSIVKKEQDETKQEVVNE